MIFSEALLLIFLIVLLGFLLYLNRRRESRRIGMRTRDAIDPEFREQIEQERARDREKKQKFEEALKKAGK